MPPLADDEDVEMLIGNDAAPCCLPNEHSRNRVLHGCCLLLVAAQGPSVAHVVTLMVRMFVEMFVCDAVAQHRCLVA